MIKKIRGVTLLEAVLALSIATIIIVLGIRQYTQYSRDRDAFALKYNVDLLFQAMRNYYYANCAEQSDPNQAGGALAPTGQPDNPFPIDTVTLKDYLDSRWRPANPLVDSSFGTLGYQMQFNNVSITNQKNENFCYYYPGTSQTQSSCASVPNTSAILYLWVAQIVVKVSDTKMALLLKGLTGADCVLDTYTSPTIVDCSKASSSSNSSYLVWQRLPSFASPGMSSSLWSSTYNVKQFNLQYTNDSVWELVSAPYGGSFYYLCGG